MHIKQRDFLLRFYPSSLSIALWLDPADRRGDDEFLRNYLRPGDTVIDVGANIGNLSLVASIAVGPTGRVYAIEPHPRIFRYLKGNLAFNHVQNVCTFNVALGQKDGRVSFSDEKWDDENYVIGKGPGIVVPMCQLDSLPIIEEHITLLKIDVEGYEKFVLQGATRVLSVTDSVYFESWDQHFAKYGYTCSDVFRLLSACGFKLFRFLGEGQIVSISTEYTSRNCENVLALRDPPIFRNVLHS